MYSSILKETYTLLYYVFICIYTVNYLTDSVCIEGGDIPNPWHTFWSKNTISGPFYSQNPQNCSCRAPSFSSKVWSLASGRVDVVRPSPTSASKLSSNFAFSKWGRLLDSHRLAAILRKFCREKVGTKFDKLVWICKAVVCYWTKLHNYHFFADEIALRELHSWTIWI